MTKELNLKTQKYLKDISTLIPSSYKNKQQFLKDMEQSIRIYYTENPNISWTDILEEFGSASEVAGAILTDFSSTEKINYIKKRKRPRSLLFAICVIVFAILILLFGYPYYWNIFKSHRVNPTHYIYDGTEVSSEEYEQKQNIYYE